MVVRAKSTGLFRQLSPENVASSILANLGSDAPVTEGYYRGYFNDLARSTPLFSSPFPAPNNQSLTDAVDVGVEHERPAVPDQWQRLKRELQAMARSAIAKQNLAATLVPQNLAKMILPPFARIVRQSR
jgi:hypothetical protein